MLLTKIKKTVLFALVCTNLSLFNSQASGMVMCNKTSFAAVQSAWHVLLSKPVLKHAVKVMNKPCVLPIFVGLTMGVIGAHFSEKLEKEITLSVPHGTILYEKLMMPRKDIVNAFMALPALSSLVVCALTSSFWLSGKIFHLHSPQTLAYFRTVCATLGYSALWWTSMNIAMITGYEGMRNMRERRQRKQREKQYSARAHQTFEENGWI
ncbi:MAG: hypothetical protein UU47_C0003G0036 [candidate division TM6 bacterium GW2011_GWE2_41_16]|nr:MAG: hypothetical protein UU47_C0003G0036 [candidate division TM6 bacterium GW2011_GWE2_41_16]